MDWIWSLQEGECTGCGICADLCPHGAIHMPTEEALPAGIDGLCTGCLICVEECPFDAIVVWHRACGPKARAPVGMGT